MTVRGKGERREKETGRIESGRRKREEGGERVAKREEEKETEIKG